MAPKKLDDFWREKVHELVEEYDGAGAPRIERELRAIAAAEDRTDWPSRRQIGRWLSEHRAMSDREKAPYRAFSWPASMEAGFLPWEASRFALDLLRREHLRGRRRPTVARVRWHWRLHQASPSLSYDLRDTFVINILVARGEEWALGDTRLDVLLAFEPWHDDAKREIYNAAFPDHPWERRDDA